MVDVVTPGEWVKTMETALPTPECHVVYDVTVPDGASGELFSLGVWRDNKRKRSDNAANLSKYYITFEPDRYQLHARNGESPMFPCDLGERAVITLVYRARARKLEYYVNGEYLVTQSIGRINGESASMVPAALLKNESVILRMTPHFTKYKEEQERVSFYEYKRNTGEITKGPTRVHPTLQRISELLTAEIEQTRRRADLHDTVSATFAPGELRPGASVALHIQTLVHIYDTLIEYVQRQSLEDSTAVTTYHRYLASLDGRAEPRDDEVRALNQFSLLQDQWDILAACWHQRVREKTGRVSWLKYRIGPQRQRKYYGMYVSALQDIRDAAALDAAHAEARAAVQAAASERAKDDKKTASAEKTAARDVENADGDLDVAYLSRKGYTHSLDAMAWYLSLIHI